MTFIHPETRNACSKEEYFKYVLGRKYERHNKNTKPFKALNND